MPLDKLSGKQAKLPTTIGGARAQHVEKKADTKVETKTAQPSPSEREPVDASGGNAGAKAAQKALGLTDAPTSSKTESAGAKSAKAGLGFLECTIGKSMRKGALVALAGLSLLQGLGAGMQPNSAVFNRQPVQRVSSLDVRAMNTMSHTPGQRALSDAQSMLASWQAQAQNDPAFTVTADRAKDLVLAALLPAKPGPNDDLVAFAKANLGSDTKALLTTVLGAGSGGFKIDGDGRAFLEKAIDKAASGGLQVVGDQADGKLHLTGKPGAQVEAINLSTIPTKRLHLDDTFVIGTIGADGKLDAKMDMQAGDQIRMRMKMPDGTTTDWMDIKAGGLGADTRNAEVALFRIGLSPNANGKIDVSNINSSRAISEPGAVLRFVNTTDNSVTDVKLNNQGTFDAGVTLPGKPGDTFSIRVTDGTNDTALANEISKITVKDTGAVIAGFDLKDPTLHHDEIDSSTGKAKFSTERFGGPLFDATGAEFTDVVQGQIGDCFFAASISTIAFHKKGTFEKIMVQKSEVDEQTGQDNTWYEVTFKERDGWKNGKPTFKDVVVKVDGDLFVRSWGGPLYGADDGDRSTAKMELWFSILEKAYAQWKGESYEAIGNGGVMSEVFQDILGVSTSSTSIYKGNETEVWKQIKIAVDNHRPIGAGTHGEDQEALYANSGVYANHAYSVLGYEVKDGEKFVKLRNPWGESEPFPGDGKNDGIFLLKLSDFTKLYSTLYYATED
jgi:hypothetical protein